MCCGWVRGSVVYCDAVWMSGSQGKEGAVWCSVDEGQYSVV